MTFELNGLSHYPKPLLLSRYLPLLVSTVSRKPSPELWLFFLCQMLAITIVTGILIFTDRIQTAIFQESAKMMAADLVVQSNGLVDPAWQRQAVLLGIDTVQSLRFPSMLFFNDQLQLTDIRAVSEGYPLRGELTASATLRSPAMAQQRLKVSLPKSGEVWLDARSAEALGAEVGDQIEVGDRSLRFSQVLVDEPGAAIPSLGFAGRALIRLIDIESTGLVVAGSRVSYSWMLAGEEKSLAIMESWLKSRLGVHDNLVSRVEGSQSTEDILNRASSFLSLGGAMAVLLAGLAAMISASRFMAGQLDNVAIMRALGASRQQLFAVYFSQLLIFSLLALLLGYLLGFGLQSLGFYALQDVLVMPSELSVSSFIAGAVTALFCLLCFAVPTLLGLIRVSPMRLLRSASAQASQKTAYIVFALGFLLLLFFYSGSWQASLIVYLGILSLAIAVAFVSVLVTKGLQIIHRRQSSVAENVQRLASDLSSGSLSGGSSLGSHALISRPSFDRVDSEPKAILNRLALRMGIDAFCRQPQTSQLRTIALSLTLTILIVIMALRAALLADWQTQLPPKAPNFFAVNILSSEVDSFSSALQAAQFEQQPLYPVARARLMAINHLSFSEWGVTNVDALASLEREMVMTESATLADDNILFAGQWHGDGSDEIEVSVEKDIADSLKIGLDDKLHFSFAGVEVIARVTSIRKLDWNSMRPNFYFILSPPNLSSFPFTYMTSFYVADQQVAKVDNLSRQHPSATLINVGEIIERAQKILAKVSLAVEALAWVTVFSGLLVMVASLRMTLDKRLAEQTIFRAIGSSASLLKRSLWVELSIGGLLAGLSAVISAQVILYSLGRWVFDMPLLAPLGMTFMVVLLSMLLVAVVGVRVLKLVYQLSPVAIWRGN
jgi:putative ABC transport system permease protein